MPYMQRDRGRRGDEFATTGDTLCDEKHPIMLEVMKFPEP